MLFLVLFIYIEPRFRPSSDVEFFMCESNVKKVLCLSSFAIKSSMSELGLSSVK
jgi:hypothetical protein